MNINYAKLIGNEGTLIVGKDVLEMNLLPNGYLQCEQHDHSFFLLPPSQVERLYPAYVASGGRQP